MSDVLAVDPDGMVTVTLAYPTQDRMLNAVSCRYIPATVQIDGQGRRVVAIEVVHDPATPNPTAAYYCNPKLLERIVLPASALRSVRPYRQ